MYSLRKIGLPIAFILLAAGGLAGAAELDRLPELCDGADAVLIEPRVPGREGGAGVALDLGAGKIYWANSTSHKISWANLDGSGGGGDLNDVQRREQRAL